MTETGKSDDASPPVVSVKDLHVSLGGHSVLRGVAFDVPRGEVLAVIGPNGSGKTTLLRALLGLITPDRGQVRLFGETRLDGVLPRVGYVPQRLNLENHFLLTVGEFLALRLGAEARGWRRPPAPEGGALRSVLDEIGVQDLLERPLAALSGGQLQRVMIAFSLLHKPDLLLLDEPTTGVDTPGEETFYELITSIHHRHRLTVLLVSHDLSMVYRHAHRVLALNGTICCEGTPEEVLNADSLREAFGVQTSPYHHHHGGTPGGGMNGGPHAH